MLKCSSPRLYQSGLDRIFPAFSQLFPGRKPHHVESRQKGVEGVRQEGKAHDEARKPGDLHGILRGVLWKKLGPSWDFNVHPWRSDKIPIQWP